MNNDNIKSLIGTKINNYSIIRYISSGAFGMVFEAVNTKTNESVALKIPIISEERNGLKWLLEEAKVYTCLNNPENPTKSIGIANMKIIKNKDKKLLVMDLLGPSLEALLSQRRKFRLKTVILIAIQLIDIIKYIHGCGYIHRDIKPDNFVVDNNLKHNVYCIDFGLAKKYLKKNGDHNSFNNGNKFCGTARYASIGTHKGFEQSRRDDLEAIGYLLIYLFRGKLPWMGIKHKDKKERNRLICESKEKVTEEELCDKLPKQFLVYLKYVKNLDFDEKPHYSALKRMFVKLYESKDYKQDKFEWEA